MAHEEIKTPAPHEQYLHNVGNLVPYKEDLKEAIRKGVKVKKRGDGGADIGDLIKQILNTSRPVAEKAWKDPHAHLLEYDVIREILEENAYRINRKGLTDEVLDQLVSNYVRTSSGHVRDTYMTQIRQMPLEDARESVKEMARFVGMPHHERHIDATTRHSTLGSRIRQYEAHIQEKVTDMYNRGDFVEKPGYNDYIHLKKDKVVPLPQHGHDGHGHTVHQNAA